MRTRNGMACMAVTLLVLLAPAASAAKAAGNVHEKQKAPKIQLAILLDTSGSMSGLIEQAKAQLWTIVNEFATTRQDGKIPMFEVALYEYGKDSIPAKEGYLRMILPLTTDLDKISEELFVLRTNGGSEYCGKVIKAATEGLQWSASNEDLKVIFIAGNEPFTQGDVDFRKACPAAIKKGIIVNTIFCGPHATGVKTHWKDGAMLADGKYMNIDHNTKAVHIAAPQDKEIAQLGVDLNKTYVGYGKLREAGRGRQAAQDANASSMSLSTAAQRAVSKSSVNYRNARWDLVDAVREGKVELAELKDEELPGELREMSVAERKAYIEKQTELRVEIQGKINKLNAARKKHVAAERKKLAKSGEDTLDAVIIKAVREQAVEKNFKFSQ